jgi:dephospho-CoA kinase
MILGITGTLGAGKGSVVEHLKSKGFVQYSTSGLLGEILDKEGKPKTRDFFSPLATSLQKEYPGGAVEKNYREKYLEEKPLNAIFEAIHRLSEANFIRSVGGKIIGVDADLETRFKRTVVRKEGEKDSSNFEDFKKQIAIEEEGGGDASRDNNIRAVINSADYKLLNNGTLEELYAQIDALPIFSE